MKNYLILLFFIGFNNFLIAQNAVIKLVSGESYINNQLLPPTRSIIESITVEFELEGKLTSGILDTTFRIIIDNRTKNNNAKLVDSTFTLTASDWDLNGNSIRIKRNFYIRHSAVKEQKFDENAYLMMDINSNNFHTIHFLSTNNSTNSKFIHTTEKSTFTNLDISDTIRYNKTFGYDNDTHLFDLKMKTQGDKTEIQVCNNNSNPIKIKCERRILLGDISKEKFSVVLTTLLKNLFIPDTGFVIVKIEPKLEEQYTEYSNFLAKQKPKEKTELEKQMTSVNKKLEELFMEKVNSISIGYFKLVSPTININRDINNSKKIEKISKIIAVDIMITNGSIRKNGIKIETDDGHIYRNKSAPITLYRLDKRKGDKLYFDDIQHDSLNYYIEVRDVINYIYDGKFNYPSDQIAHLTPDKTIDSLFVGSTVNELLDVNIFSDMLALLGRRANGVIQTQVTATFLTNTKNVGHNFDITPHNFVKAYFKLSKFDSKFSQLDSLSFKSKTLDSVNRLYLNQIAFLQAGLKTNLLRIGIGNNQQLLINAGAEINLTSADSLFQKDIVTVNYYPEIEYIISRLDNFGLETSIKYLRQVAPENSPFKNKESIWIFNPQVTIYYYPFSNPDNKIYVRYAHYAQLGDAKYNFPQFQFGFKTNLFGNKN